MWRVGGLCCAILVASASPASARSEVNPLGKVIELLDSLAAKITQEGEAAEKAHKEFVSWCEDASRNKKFEIQTATSRKAKLEASIGKLTSDAEAASAKIEELAGSIAGDEADLKSSTAIRDKESADFKASEAELMEAIDTLGRAITIIEREMRKNPAAFAQVDAKNVNSLVQSISAVVDAASFSAADKQRLAALVQAHDADADGEADMGAPAAAAYKSHSSGIVDTLEDLKEKAEEQLASLRKEEVNARHNYEMLKQSLEDQMAADTKDKNDEAASMQAAKEAKATAQGELQQTTKALSDGKLALETVNGDCMTTAADHEQTTEARKEELQVIAEAKKALMESTSGAAEQAYSFFQGSATLHTHEDLAKAEVVTLVRRLAKEHHSAALQQLASRIAAVQKFGASAGEDPFAKVKAMISDMISRLQAEAGADATEKAYCDEQLDKTQTKKGELEHDVAKLTSKIDQASAKSVSLKEDVKQFQKELAALSRSQAEMDKIRYESHQAYVEAKADLEQGLEGVRKALSVLRDYYGSGAAAAAMIQSSDAQPAVPEKHSKAGGAGSSIIGMLEVVESDFAKSLAKEETAEADAESEYEKTTQENKISKTMKEQDVKYATQEYKTLDKTISELSSDRETTSTELTAVLDYFAKIKERCIAKPETYSERAERRKAEIEGLKEALRILEDEVAFTQRGKHSGAQSRFLGFRQ